MKIAVIIGCDIFTPYNYGGKLCATSHCELLRQVCGAQAVHLFTFTEASPATGQIPADTTVYPAVASKVQALVQALQNRKVFSAATEKKLIADVRRFAPDAIWFEGAVLGRLARQFRDIPKVTFLQNIEQLYAKNKVLHESLVYLPSYTASTYNETQAVRLSQQLICLNRRDGDALEKLYHRKPNAYLPIALRDTFDEAACRAATLQPRTLLFVGSNFPPNAQGITWFVHEVMPRLTGWRLKIVGKGMESLRPALAGDNVEVLGGVDDLAPHYYGAAAMVMPILYGDGMKVKTAEAMMYGKRIFASPEALTGYDVSSLAEITRCPDAEAYVAAIAQYTAPQGYFPAVRAAFLSDYELGTQQAALGDLLEKLLQTQPMEKLLQTQPKGMNDNG